MPLDAAIELEVTRLIDRDDFYMRLDSAVENIDTRLNDGTRRGALEWEIEELRADVAMLRPWERPKFRAFCASKYPMAARLMGWKAEHRVSGLAEKLPGCASP